MSRDHQTPVSEPRVHSVLDWRWWGGIYRGDGEISEETSEDAERPLTGVVFNTKTLPLDQVTMFLVDNPIIQDLLHYPLFFTSTISGNRGGVVCQPGMGSDGTKDNLTTLETGWSRPIDGGRQRRYALLPTWLSIGKGPNLQWEIFCEGWVVWMSLASRKTILPALNSRAGVRFWL